MRSLNIASVGFGLNHFRRSSMARPSTAGTSATLAMSKGQSAELLVRSVYSQSPLQSCTYSFPLASSHPRHAPILVVSRAPLKTPYWTCTGSRRSISTTKSMIPRRSLPTLSPQHRVSAFQPTPTIVPARKYDTYAVRRKGNPDRRVQRKHTET